MLLQRAPATSPAQMFTVDLVNQLPWHLFQRLQFAIDLDISNAVSPAEAAEVPVPQQAHAWEPDVLQEEVAEAVARDTSAASSSTTPRVDMPATSSSDSLSLAAPPSGELRPRVAGLPLRVDVHSMSRDLCQEYQLLTRNFALGPVPVTATPESLVFREGGVFLWKSSSETPASAVCRHFGEGPVMTLRGGDMALLEDWQRAGNNVLLTPPSAALELASDAFRFFFREREHLSQRLISWESAQPPFREVTGGSWLRGAFNHVSAPSAEPRIGFHGTSMHSLERVASKGLEDGWNGLSVGRRTVLGIYYHIAERGHLCLNYMLYTALERQSGFIFAPMIQLMAPQQDPLGRTQHIRRKQNHQEVTYSDVCVVTHIWLHVRHVSEFKTAEPTDFIFAEGKFDTSLELDPTLPRPTLLARSRAIRRSPDERQ